MLVSPVGFLFFFCWFFLFLPYLRPDSVLLTWFVVAWGLSCSPSGELYMENRICRSTRVYEYSSPNATEVHLHVVSHYISVISVQTGLKNCLLPLPSLVFLSFRPVLHKPNQMGGRAENKCPPLIFCCWTQALCGTRGVWLSGSSS